MKETHHKFEDQIKKCETLKQIFDVTNKFYDTNKPLGIITGNIVKNKIPDLVHSLRLTER